ncbi:MAG: radical SAM family heme chaperone HemW [Bacteroidales bacterium]|nr:radical SAM family heme chaperone HemW [Bacteroidales bacterium]
MIYIHVPFCRSFCTYCGFYSELCSRDASQQVQMRFYAEGIINEIKSRGGAEKYRHEGPDTLYIGGGTPSVLPAEELERIVKALGRPDYEEFTLEVNPDDINGNGREYLQRLRDAGVTRISMGIQSFDDGILRWMNRRHDAAGAHRAFRLLREAGFGNISIDLIFGLSQLELPRWEKSIREAIALNPEHISAYQLSIDEDSALASMVSSARYEEASDEQCREQYELLCKLLAEAGYEHYEISNWAKPGFRAVHNSAYWKRVPYCGLGPGAHSLISKDGRASVRQWNTRECARIDAEGSLRRWQSEGEALSLREIAEERVMLALRTSDGLEESELRAICSDAKVDALMDEKALQSIRKTDGSAMVRIPEERFFVSDDIISDLFNGME